MKIRNQFNFDKFNKLNFEYNSGEIISIPDQSLTIKEIVKRFASGRPLNATNRQPLYEDNPDIENPDILRRPDIDIVDVQEEVFMLHQKTARQKMADSETVKTDEAKTA